MDHVGVVERLIMEYSFPTADGTISSIAKPTVQTNNFEILNLRSSRSSSQVCNFLVLPEGDPNKQLSNFLEICDTFKFNGVGDDVVRLRFFPFLVCDAAKDWLQSLPAGTNFLMVPLWLIEDVAASGTIIKKLSSEAFNIIDEITTNVYSYGLDRTDKRVADIRSINIITTLSAQMAALTQKVDNLRAAI
ncbi:UNVERIFIED_CONTAM: hypothetical protein Sangu_2469700 [Sesamum angustifolium]|uniref:Uncharacterized protein n=1 Tax=Sesamum angustifolium TaxID=2727405 RepID=A0AAW2IX29_9LAMI